MMQDFPPIFAIICCYHGNTLSATVKEMCLAHLHPKANICAKFHENWWKTEEVVRDARFFPHVCHNMPLPWQHSFCHSRKMCLAHLHRKAHICAKFHENWSKTEEVVRDTRFAMDRPTDDTLIPIIPLQTSFGGGIITQSFYQMSKKPQSACKEQGGYSEVKFYFSNFFFVDCYCFYPDECASPVYYKKKKTITIC